MNIATARMIVALMNATVRLQSPDNPQANCPLCESWAKVARTISDVGGIVRYNKCPECGCTFKSVSPPRDVPVGKSLPVATNPPNSCKVRIGKKKRGR